MVPGFAWDARKAQGNLAKHGVSFEEAATAFADPLSLTILDQDHSLEEARLLLLGRSARDRLLVVSHTDDGTTIRIISARPATPLERRQYAELA